jgi:putative membrane protein
MIILAILVTVRTRARVEHGADTDHRVPMATQVMLAMLAPLLMVLAAPVTLLLRTLPVARRPLRQTADRSLRNPPELSVVGQA